MTIQLDTTQRLFWIQSISLGGTVNVVCNLHHIKEVTNYYFSDHEPYRIFHLWNGKWKAVSKKYLKDMQEANKK